MRGNGTNNKRRRVDEENEGAEKEETGSRRIVALGMGLRGIMGGRRSCRGDELIPLLLAKKRVRVVHTFQVTVQTMTGRSFGVILESGASATVGQLKAEIEEVEGTFYLCFARRPRKGAKSLYRIAL